MSSVQNITQFEPYLRNRSARRTLYADWAFLFAAIALLGAVVMVEFAAGKASFVTGTLDRLNAYDTRQAAIGAHVEMIITR